MDFFQSQDHARRKTKQLVVLFALAVVAINAAVYALLFPVFGYLERKDAGRYRINAQGQYVPEVAQPRRSGFFQADWFLIVSGGVAAVVLLGSGYKSLQLARGGAVVARDLGGRLVDPNTGDADERKLMNVVEEMAIASGVPVPEVYLLDDEPGINTFSAGKNYSDAAIGVTRGAIKLLRRNELQGVVAHEFSHLLNGDMRMNMRLIGVLHGILVISIIGQVILRSTFHGARASRDNRGGGALPLLVVGLGLMVIGYIGVFFGRLIKSAISRQRVLLADAAAVQFTRDPEALGGALKKIGGLSYGSKLLSARSEEVSHMVFANATSGATLSALATHPPLEERIRAVDPGWDGKFVKVKLPEISSSMQQDEGAGRRVPPGIPGMEGHPPLVGAITAAAAVGEIGKLGADQVRRGRQIHASLPSEWLDAAHNISGAQALIFSMLLAQDDELRVAEMAMLREETDAFAFEKITDWHPQVAAMESPQKIALIDLAIPALKRMSADEYTRFVHVMERLVASDGEVDLFEFMLQKIVHRHLEQYFSQSPPPKIRYRDLHSLEYEANVLLSTLANFGAHDPAEVDAAFRAGVAGIEAETGSPLVMLPAAECGLANIGRALDRFDHASPLVKRTLLMACGAAVMADGKAVNEEIELLRAIADTIGCPIPPFVGTGEAEHSA